MPRPSFAGEWQQRCPIKKTDFIDVDRFLSPRNSDARRTGPFSSRKWRLGLDQAGDGRFQELRRALRADHEWAMKDGQ